MREEQQKAKLPTGYDRLCVGKTREERAALPGLQRAAGRADAGARRRAARLRRPDPRRGQGAAARRPGDPQGRRLPDLPPGRRRRRPPDGHHPRRARRGVDLLDAQARAALRLARLGAAGVRAHAAAAQHRQVEDLQAQEPGRAADLVPRAGLPARGAAQLPRADGLLAARRRGDLHLRRHGRATSTGRGSTRSGRSSTWTSWTGSTATTCASCRSRTWPAGSPITSYAGGCCPPSRPPSSAPSCSPRPRWSTSGCRCSPRPRGCSASCSSTTPTSRSTPTTRPRCSPPTRGRCSRRPSRRSSDLGDLGDGRHRGRAAGALVEGLGPQAEARVRPGAGRGHRPPGVAAAVRVARAARPRPLAGPAAGRARGSRGVTLAAGAADGAQARRRPVPAAAAHPALGVVAAASSGCCSRAATVVFSAVAVIRRGAAGLPARPAARPTPRTRSTRTPRWACSPTTW